MLVLDCMNIVGGYLAFLALGWSSMQDKGGQPWLKIVMFTPPYWVLMSLAAWKAVVEIVRRPHHWNKTPHFRSREWQAASDIGREFSFSPV